MKALVSILLLFFLHPCWGQYATGLVEETVEYEQIIQPEEYKKGAKSMAQNISQVDLSPYCPTPQDQGTISSCVGWAVGYAAFTIQLAIENNWLNERDKITNQAMSALFIYHHTKLNDCQSGSRISDALEFLKNSGDVHSVDFDENVQDCEKTPSAEELQEAKNYLIKNYFRLFNFDDTELEKVNATKLSLIDKKPVIVGVRTLKNFFKLRKGITVWNPEMGDQTFAGGHAMTVVGFDDERKAFKLMNSWGTNWGADGFIWIRYKDFAKYAKYGLHFSIASSITSEEKQPVFSLRYPVWEADEWKFESIIPVFDGEAYVVEKSHHTGDMLQIVSEGLINGFYLYAFSIDPNGKANLHFPRLPTISTNGLMESELALIHQNQETYIIPNETTALSLEHVGTEYLCLVYSPKFIINFSEFLKNVENHSGEVTQAKLEKYLLSPKNRIMRKEPKEITKKAKKLRIVIIRLEVM